MIIHNSIEEKVYILAYAKNLMRIDIGLCFLENPSTQFHFDCQN